MTQNIQFGNTDPVAFEKLAENRKLAAGIAHELWNPLTVIKTMMFAMRADIPAEDPRCVDFDVINDEIGQMEHTIQRFLDYTLPADPIFVPVSLGHIVSNAMKLVVHKAEDQGVHIETSVDNDVIILADQRQIELVFVNLALNALHTMPEGGKLSIVAKTEQVFVNLALNVLPAASDENKLSIMIVDMDKNGKKGEQNGKHDRVGVAVTDTGSGIPTDVIDRIFEPFVIERSGLGLAIVQQIVKRHGGQIAAHNRPEGGATFTVTLPLVDHVKSSV